MIFSPAYVIDPGMEVNGLITFVSNVFLFIFVHMPRGGSLHALPETKILILAAILLHISAS